MATPLIKRFYTDRTLHIRSFGLSLAGGVLMCLALYAVMPAGHYEFSLQWWHAALVPLGIYWGGISAVWMHNATHGSFRNKTVNLLCGHIAGVHQLWGFTGWKLIHLLHHMYSDQVEHDTHPPKGMNFWQFTKTMFLYSSKVVSQRYREHWGDTPLTKALQRATLVIFAAMALTYLLFWYLLLGAVGFVWFFIPSYIANHLLYAHINYRAHPADPNTGETAPANLNHNLYYRLANAAWHGIYFHGNHHRKPLLFNPRYMESSVNQTSEEPLKKAA
jgi:stearoyl-CoA desaturase (delta-9 desaturase)